MRALDPAAGTEAHPGEDVAPEAFDERGGFAGVGRQRGLHRSGRQALDKLLDEPQALLDFADADPDPRIDVAGLHHRHLEVERVVGRVPRRATRIERAPGGAADVAAGGELLREGRRQYPGADGPILQRGGVLVEFDELREAGGDESE